MSDLLSKACLERVSIPYETSQTSALRGSEGRHMDYLLGEDGVRKAWITAVDFQFFKGRVALCVDESILLFFFIYPQEPTLWLKTGGFEILGQLVEKFGDGGELGLKNESVAHLGVPKEEATEKHTRPGQASR